MISLQKTIERLKESHRNALLWFQEHQGQDVPWPQPMPDGTFLVNKAIVRRQGQGKFWSDVLAAYGNRCAITACDVPEALEAAHIFRYLGAA